MEQSTNSQMEPKDENAEREYEILKKIEVIKEELKRFTEESNGKIKTLEKEETMLFSQSPKFGDIGGGQKFIRSANPFVLYKKTNERAPSWNAICVGQKKTGPDGKEIWVEYPVTEENQMNLSIRDDENVILV